MEVMTVVGKRSVNFTGQDGNPVSGVNLYVLCADPYVDGQKSDKLFVSDNLRSNLSYFPVVGDEIMVDFNRWGKISNITQLP